MLQESTQKVLKKSSYRSMKHVLHDIGGRRLEIDRRQFSYSIHVPERRSGKERRSGFDKR
jgi:hypothetical protein